jgi:hypothetical protein
MADVTVTPKESFTGYPSGVRTKFETGVAKPVPASYARILADKKLIERPKTTKSAPDAADE